MQENLRYCIFLIMSLEKYMSFFYNLKNSEILCTILGSKSKKKTIKSNKNIVLPLA